MALKSNCFFFVVLAISRLLYCGFGGQEGHAHQLRGLAMIAAFIATSGMVGFINVAIPDEIPEGLAVSFATFCTLTVCCYCAHGVADNVSLSTSNADKSLSRRSS
jgi:heme A synthase